MSVWLKASKPSSLRRGGILLAWQLWRHDVAFHKVSTVAVMRLSFDQAHLASVIVQ